jgi:hypothetical protein
MSLEKNPVALYANVSIGASGAPTLTPKKCLGIVSMVRTGAGAYTINLGLSASSVDTYQRLLDLDVNSINATAPAWASVYVVQDNSANLSAPNVKIQLLSAAGSAVDPSSGEVLLINLVLSNSTAI